MTCSRKIAVDGARRVVPDDAAHLVGEPRAQPYVVPHVPSGSNQSQKPSSRTSVSGSSSSRILRYPFLPYTPVYQIPRTEYDVAMPYSSGIRRYGITDKAELDLGFERFRKAVGDLTVVAKRKIPAGNVLAVDVSVFLWLLAVSI